LKDWSDFPTIPQIFINGELIGGSDIVLEMYQSGDLQKILAPE
jgi:monothiol glutaredoxin